MDRRDRILGSARECFLRKGYYGASIDEIVSAAGVSKPTVYKLVGNKEELFAAIVTSAAEEILEALVDVEYRTGPDLETSLCEFALRYAEILLAPPMLDFHRLAVSEAARFPELGRRYFAAGPRTVEAGLAEYLAHLSKDGELQIEDVALASQHFWALVLSPRRQALLFGVPETEAPELEDSVRNGVLTFIRAYRPLDASNSRAGAPSRASRT